MAEKDLRIQIRVAGTEAAAAAFNKVKQALKNNAAGFSGINKQFDNYATRFKTAGNIMKQALTNLYSPIGKLQGILKNAGNSMRNWGRNIQWAGQRLLFTVSVPLVLFAKSAIETALKVEKEWVRVRKVYGDSTTSAEEMARVQNDILAPAVSKLSVKYAKHQDEVVKLVAEWAKMGFEGQELADTVAETMRISTLGEIDMAEATEVLRSIMSTFGLSVEEAGRELNAFNTIENNTAIAMDELARTFPKVSSVFKLFNISAREGAAIMAGMRQRGVQASEAAHALKFGLTRLAAPTDKALELLEMYNIELFDTEGNMRNGIEVLKDSAKEFENMTDKERVAFMTTVFGRRQVDRLTKAFEAILDPQSDFNKGLDMSKDDAVNAVTALKELNEILESQPLSWERLGIIMENVRIIFGQFLLKVLEPLIPLLIGAMDKLVDWFGKLNPLSKLLAVGLGALAIVFPILLIVVGAFVEILGLLFSAAAALLTPVGLIGLVVVARVLGPLWNELKDSANLLGGGLRGLAGYAILLASQLGLIDQSKAWEYVEKLGIETDNINKEQIIQEITESIADWKEKLTNLWNKLIGFKDFIIKAYTWLSDHRWLVYTVAAAYAGAKAISFLSSVNAAIMALTGGAGFTTAVGTTGVALTTVLLPALVLVAGAWAVYKIWQAYEAYIALQKELNSLKTVLDEGRVLNEKLREAELNASDPEIKERLKRIGDENEIAAEKTQKLIDRYEGIPGAINAMIDFHKLWYEKVFGWLDSLIGKAAEFSKSLSAGELGKVIRGDTGEGTTDLHNGGVIKAQSGAIIPGSSPLRDRVSLLAEPGEGIMSKQAVSNFLKTGNIPSGGGGDINITIQAGVINATSGELREFSRQIVYKFKELALSKGLSITDYLDNVSEV